jgi:putative endonuclease
MWNNQKEWFDDLTVGDFVCDCRYHHVKVVGWTVSGSGDYNLDLEDDMFCSARHCCSPVDHPKHWWLYIVRCKDNSFYTGITTDLERRLKEHNGTKKGAKYTRTRRPIKLIKSFVFDTRSEASKAECKVKKMSKTKKLQLGRQDLE